MTQPTKWERVRDKVAPFVDSRRSKQRIVGALAAALKAETSVDAEEDLQAHGRSALIAASLGDVRAAEAWLDDYATRYCGATANDSEASQSLLAVRMAILMNTRRREESDRLFEAIDWSRTFPSGWIRNLRLAKAITFNRREAVVEALRPRSPSSPLRLSGTDRATTLRLLGEHFLTNCRNHERARRILQKAREAFGSENHFDWQLGLASTDELLALVAQHQNRLDDARVHSESALARLEAVGLSSPALRLKSMLADVHFHLAEGSRAKILLREVIAKWPTSREARRQIAPTVMLSQARLAVVLSAERETSEALAWLKKAAATLKHCDTPKYRARFLELKARTLGNSGRPDGLRRAFALLKQAEKLYVQIGDGHELGLVWVRCLRAELYVRAERAREAMEEVAFCAGTRAFQTELRLQDNLLLLKSRALLLKDVPRPERLYEDVLGSLGVARNPVTLFRVCANLYLYTWELNDDLELTDFHLRQVNRMAEHLPAPTFQRLYTEHVTQPVFERALVRTFGLPRSHSAN